MAIGNIDTFDGPANTPAQLQKAIIGEKRQAAGTKLDQCFAIVADRFESGVREIGVMRDGQELQRMSNAGHEIAHAPICDARTVAYVQGMQGGARADSNEDIIINGGAFA